MITTVNMKMMKSLKMNSVDISNIDYERMLVVWAVMENKLSIDHVTLEEILQFQSLIMDAMSSTYPRSENALLN